MEKLIWNVFVENINARKIKVVNALDYNWIVKADIYAAYKVSEKDNDFEYFSKAVKNTLMHEYWARSEYETIITSWPPYIDAKEFDRLNKEKEEHIKQYGNFYCTNVNLTINAKIDVYNQIMMNWDPFIKYLWENRKLIRYFYQDYKRLYNRRRPKKLEHILNYED